MQSKNMADYTNFNGKTNKRIMQAPGGTSSFSIGWTNQTDYGPQRTIKRKNINTTPSKPSQNTQNQNKWMMTNEPIKVMEIQEPETKKMSNTRPPLYPQQLQTRPTDYRTCVKIHEQKSSIILGDNNYNYWKETANKEQYYRQASKKSQQIKSQEKTSIKIQHPPGGRSTFIFG